MKFPILEDKSLLRTPKIGQFNPVEEAHHLFKFVKSTDALDGLYARSIPLQSEALVDFRLIPISKIHKDDAHLFTQLTTWRNDNIDLFPGSSPTDEESTGKWLDQLVLENQDRILFLVVDKHGQNHGHLGVWIRDGDRFEIDNVIKAKTSSVKGLFTSAVITLCNWVEEYTGSKSISLRVLSTNNHAIKFYSKIGFEEVSQIPVSKESSETWIEMKVSLTDLHDVPELILTAGPSIGPFETSLVGDALRTGWNHHHSDYLNLFPEIFAEYVGAKYAIPTDSCTSALHLSMWALGIGPGDEVIVPEVTWVATANAVKYVGATPIFADIDPVTWCMDPTKIESLITEKTKAIIPVHLYGYVADIDPINAICKKYNLHLVQDAAPGIGSIYKGSGVGAYGDISCFSFQGAKLLVSGEGGVLTTNDPELYAKAYKIGDSGRRPGTFWIELLGKKMKMSNMTAALAIGQMQSAERQIEKKRNIRDWYIEELSGIEGTSMQEELPDTRSICWMSSLHVNRTGFNRDEFRKNLLEKGIDTRPVFSPISQYPIWGETLQAKSNALLIGENSVNLPSGIALSRGSIEVVGKEIRRLLG